MHVCDFVFEMPISSLAFKDGTQIYLYIVKNPQICIFIVLEHLMKEYLFTLYLLNKGKNTVNLVNQVFSEKLYMQ